MTHAPCRPPATHRIGEDPTRPNPARRMKIQPIRHQATAIQAWEESASTVPKQGGPIAKPSGWGVICPAVCASRPLTRHRGVEPSDHAPNIGSGVHRPGAARSAEGVVPQEGFLCARGECSTPPTDRGKSARSRRATPDDSHIEGADLLWRHAGFGLPAGPRAAQQVAMGKAGSRATRRVATLPLASIHGCSVPYRPDSQCGGAGYGRCWRSPNL